MHVFRGGDRIESTDGVEEVVEAETRGEKKKNFSLMLEKKILRKKNKFFRGKKNDCYK